MGQEISQPKGEGSSQWQIWLSYGKAEVQSSGRETLCMEDTSLQLMQLWVMERALGPGSAVSQEQVGVESGKKTTTKKPGCYLEPLPGLCFVIQPVTEQGSLGGEDQGLGASTLLV